MTGFLVSNKSTLPYSILQNKEDLRVTVFVKKFSDNE